MENVLELELAVWQRRCEALEAMIQLLENQVASSKIARRETIYSLLKGLRAFGNSHFTYFYDGFLKKRLKLTDSKGNKFPPAMILRAITDQMAYDVEVISRALDQRWPTGQTSDIAEVLAKADLLAQMALRPAIDCDLIAKDTAVLTYFQKSFTVRVIPYAKAAIVGIPFTALQLSRDLLAIPHEVAHHIFRHGSTAHQAISQKLRHTFTQNNTDSYLRNWVEEIFADAYGCLISGPVMAIDFQDLQLDDPEQEFTDARIDYEDPVPVVRPDNYTKVLGFSKNKAWYPIADLLQTRWDKKRDAYLERKPEDGPISFRVENSSYEFDLSSTPTFMLHTVGGSSQINVNLDSEIRLDSIREKGRFFDEDYPLPLDKLVMKMLKDIFTPVAKQTADTKRGYLQWSGSNADLEKITTDDQLDKLYEYFDQAHSTIKQVGSLAEQEQYIKENPGKPVTWLPELTYNESSFQLDPSLQAAGLNVNNLWVDYVKRWTIRNDYKHLTDANKVKELLADERKALAKDNANHKEWGWVNLAMADGWVTRGPEPNPTGE